MKTNIFKDASFGKLYKTMDGSKAVYLGNHCLDLHFCATEHTIVIRNYLNDGRETMYEHMGIDDSPHNIISEWVEESMENHNMTSLEMFKQLPHLNGNYEVVDDCGYTPSLYHFDGHWCVDWIHCEEGDSLMSFHASTPEGAIKKAYDNHKQFIKKK